MHLFIATASPRGPTGAGSGCFNLECMNYAVPRSQTETQFSLDGRLGLDAGARMAVLRRGFRGEVRDR